MRTHIGTGSSHVIIKIHVKYIEILMSCEHGTVLASIEYQTGFMTGQKEAHQDRILCPMSCRSVLEQMKNRKGGMEMRELKKPLRLVLGLAMVFCIGLFLMGCATSKQLMAVQEQAQKALEKAEMALEKAESAKAMVSDEAQKAEAAVLRAEKAADRSEQATIRAEQAADKAEAMAEKAERSFIQKMKK